QPQRSELEQRILFAALLPADATQIEIRFDDPALPPDALRWPEVLLLLGALRDLVGASRALGPQNLIEPEKNAADNGGSIDAAELTLRATPAVNSLTADLGTLEAAAGDAALRAALLAVSFYGIADAVPHSSNGTDPGLAAQAASAAAEVRRRLNAAGARD